MCSTPAASTVCARSSPGSARVGKFVAAVVVATLAFIAYSRTLLPGVDMGDTGGFQAAVLWPDVSARQAYPLYYGLAKPFVNTVSAANPARGLNLFSAIFGAAAVGLLTLLCSLVTASVAAGIAAGVLLAFSYTFWSQAIIAEVYTLHLALVLVCGLALYTYSLQPSRARLAVFFAVYAFAFGNHLSMILLFVPFTVFLLQVTPERRTLFASTTVGLAIAIAALGVLQYWPNFQATWYTVNGPVAWSDRFATFWFDTTKTDWRETMVLGVPGDQLASRAGMWWFDARQQFGLVGLLLAAIGAARLLMISRPWVTLVILAYAINTLFAFTYNVGDTHVFYLPSHLFTAFAAGAALGRSAGWERSAGSKRTRPALHIAATIVVITYAGWRAWDTWPAIDRHDDRRAEALVTRMALGVNPQTGVLVTNLNWQLENALPFGPLFPVQPDPLRVSPDLLEEISGLPPGTPYVLCVLTPPREEHLDPQMLKVAVDLLTANHAPLASASSYQVMAGLVGERPLVTRSADRPFRVDFRLLDEPFTVRMESWLVFDTFRRAGFGHVIRGRDHVLTVERGVSLVWFDRNARASTPVYAASLYAPGERYRISSVSPALARLLQ
ncbi:MAG: hypothetical protein DMF87_13595 [Acidobacteria bacterium]|nr:MAG: hypothetical protein DMF87_13595 [Acidobacteriota bacterium]